jgi:predicted dinucleotide-binding enzyme
MKKTFGIIGAGNLAKAVASHLLKAGYAVILSSRKDPAFLADTIAALGAGATAGTPTQAINADIVLLALPWTQLATLPELTNWDNRLVIDATNHFITYAPDFQLADLQGRASSEVVSDYVPGARLVKAFNTLPAKVLATDPQEGDSKRVLFLSGNHPDANAEVAAVIGSLGFSAVDLGPLAIGGKLQQTKAPLAALNLFKKG